MDRELLTKREREQRASNELAAHLDALSRPLAERVLGRAIEIQRDTDDAQAAAADVITYDELKEIGLEVGIPEEAIKQALFEELDTDKDHEPKLIERATAPRQIRGGTIADISREEIVRRLRSYVESIEGIEFDRQDGNGLTWRQAPADPRVIRTRYTTQPDGHTQLVELEWDNNPRKKWWRWAFGLFILGAIFGVPALGGIGIIIGIGAALSGVVAWFKRAARRARKHINRALSALVDESEKTDDWLEMIEHALEEVFDG